uniref:Capsid n=1 Tax=Avian nephritis virus 2 TaxID=336961 RepID=F8RWW1_9VIRU|nr:capsid [Avian nephritis virus 2]
MPGPAGPVNGGARPKTQMAKPKKAKKSPSQKKPSQQKPLRREIKKVEKQVRVLKKRTNGPKQNDLFTTTVTLGTISGQSDNGLTRQIRLPLNPLLLKSSDGGSTTPLSIRGSMYEMWKVIRAELIATPLTGGANIVGSVGFMVLTLNGLEATADSIDSIKARKHVQIPLGRLARLRLTARECAGPREGWWLTDTSQSPADSYGPAVDLMIAYATTNLLNTSGGASATFLGTLWQVEIRVTYAFSTYNPKPGLQTMVSQTLAGSNHQVTIRQSTTDGSLIMTTNDTNLLSILTPRVAGQRSGKSQTVWAIAGAAVEAAAPLLGPWGWLLKGGFWLVRKIFGASARDTTSQYQIYPSIEAAMSDQPIFGQTGTSTTVTLPIVHISEVMNPNPENNDLSNPTSRSFPPTPPTPSTDPILPLAELTGQPGVPPLYTFDGSTYTPPTNWLGSTTLLTGIPAHKRVTGNLSNFGVTNLQMSKVTATAIEIYDFTDFGVFFGTGSYLGEGGIHTGKTLIHSLMSGQTPNPWLAANQSGTTWYLPTWVGFPTPGAGDYFLQMQDVTDTTTHTTSVNVYFLVAYHQSRRLIAFFNTGGTARPAPTSMLCLYNVDCGRAPQTPYPTFQSTLQSLTQSEVDAKTDPDSDDDISLAGSVIGDEFDSVDHLEREREDLMRRLRDLDLRRFQI